MKGGRRRELFVWYKMEMYTPAPRLMIGLTNFTTKAHICRATLEAVCFQSREVCVHTLNISSVLHITQLLE